MGVRAPVENVLGQFVKQTGPVENGLAEFGENASGHLKAGNMHVQNELENVSGMRMPISSSQFPGNQGAIDTLTRDTKQGIACASNRQKGAAKDSGIGTGAHEVFDKKANLFNQPACASSFLGRASEQFNQQTRNVQASLREPQGPWADRVRVSSAKSRFCLYGALEQEHGHTDYTLPDELIEDNFNSWTRCLIGFIPGSSFLFHAARRIAFQEWKSYGIEAVSSYEDFFVFRFKNEENLHNVLVEVLGQCHASFVFDRRKLSKVPVWIKLKGLPFTLWSNKALSFVSGIVGKPLACDRTTHEKTGLSYARVCVEVDANRPYIHSFDLHCKLSSSPIHINVEYDWKPQRCSLCCVYGHSCEPTGNILERDERKRKNEEEGTKKAKPNLIDTLVQVSKPIIKSETNGLMEKGDSSSYCDKQATVVPKSVGCAGSGDSGFAKTDKGDGSVDGGKTNSSKTESARDSNYSLRSTQQGKTSTPARIGLSTGANCLGKGNSADKGKASIYATGSSISRGSWADKARASSENEEFSDEGKGNHSNAILAAHDIYSLRPRR